PTPGSPPTRTTDAGTRPPPSTRSSSGMPVAIRSASSASTSTRRRRGLAAAPADGGATVDSSTSVPNSPHPGHFPNQRPEEYPHSGQEKTEAAALATRPSLGAGPDGLRDDSG